MSCVYANVNSKKPQSYWDYDKYEVTYNDIEKYELIEHIGRGKYSEVFHGECVETQEQVVIKALKPVRFRKIKRELSILKNLDHVNIVKLIDVVQDPFINMPSFVFEYIDFTETRRLFSHFKISDVKFYFKELLKALDYSHSMGIMHRDVKPQNIIIDHKRGILKLIDWGLAEYYHPGQNYSVRVASRYFKSPELLIGYERYDYSIDLWSVGCMLASLVFRCEPFFKGNSNEDQLVKIIDVLGKSNLESYIDKHKIKMNSGLAIKIIKRHDKYTAVNFDSLEIKSDLYDSNAIDLINNLLVYDHTVRFTAQQAMNHAFFTS